MSDGAAIRVEGLGKRFSIGPRRAGYRTLREGLGDAFRHPVRRLRNGSSGNGTGSERKSKSDNTIWALRDVSFEVAHGEAVGIIGANGAGKSTLLKILSRITEPTRGQAVLRGRVGSLLEVGTGFHPELTGRENVFLNGAILGMKRVEIERKFDQIVAFAEVAKFIDTPVKHYSSGMYLRLAFAVAAHLEPEILVVDEVLAVGDIRFQKKCLGMMGEVAREGRTVLFVSHNLQAITRLCPNAILLEKGRMAEYGPSARVVARYLGSGLGTTAQREWPDPAEAPGNEVVRLRAIRVRTADQAVTSAVDIRKPVGIEVEFDVLQPGHELVVNLGFDNDSEVIVFVTSDHGRAWYRRPRPVGRYRSVAWIPGNLLSEGTLLVGAGVCTENPFRMHVDVAHAVAFEVVDSLDGGGARGDISGNMAGAVRPLIPWESERLEDDPDADLVFRPVPGPPAESAVLRG